MKGRGLGTRVERGLFGFFFVSGFCSLVLQVVWLRLAMSSFGVNAPLISAVLAIFMGGLGLGSYLGGCFVERENRMSARGALRIYGLLEGGVAIGALFAPLLLSIGQSQLESVAGSVARTSAAYYVVSGLWIGLALIVPCTCMGATLPVAMQAMRESGGQGRTFSFLYLANVIGATYGALFSAFFMVELVGLDGSWRVAAVLNCLLCVGALKLASGLPAQPTRDADVRPAVADRHQARGALGLLFVTGFVSLAMEVIWTRLFTPYLGTVVYAFATILATYLAATAVGTWAYRHPSLGLRRIGTGVLGGLVGVSAALCLVATDPRLGLAPGVRVLVGLVPFCFLVGILTPRLIDEWSGDTPGRAGLAYAVNVLGSILGPLVAAFAMLPALGERGAVLTVAVLVLVTSAATQPRAASRVRLLASYGLLMALLVFQFRSSTAYEALLHPRVVRRDYEATVIAAGQGFQRQLLINGYGITALTPATKVMAHLPLAIRPEPPTAVLVVAFGMGTTFRAALSWQVETTVVDLIPSVPDLFAYFHADADSLVRLPYARVVVDDGRRFLRRDRGMYDVIVIDPPPPAPAVSSSLLYSIEFYRLVKQHLRAGGVMQQWVPAGAGDAIQASILRSVMSIFRHTRTFRSIDGRGLHILGSDAELLRGSGATLAGRLPQAAVVDLVEWGPAGNPIDQFDFVLRQEVSPSDVVNRYWEVPALTDERPVNEYYFVREYLPGLWRAWFDCCVGSSPAAAQ